MKDPKYGIKQYVAVVRNRRGGRFRVFETGDPKYYMFDQLIGETSASSRIMFPILKNRLRDDIRRALRYGWGNSL